MLEIRASDVLGLVGGGGGGGGGGESAIVRSFRCGEPVAVIEDSTLVADERQRLKALRAACPAFFAARGEKRKKLDWLHRRRKIRSPEAACAAA